jgi:phosphatidylethanolamine/phosphatidyl-N-methylethanolamine N-methyltransferase
MVKPGGRIVVLNHFLSPNPFLAWWEKVLNPMFVKIGWRSDLALEDCLKDTGLSVQYNFKMTRVDLWQIVVLGEEGATPSRPVQPAPAPADDGPAGKSHAALAIE